MVPRKERRFLEDDADVGAQALDGHIAHVVAVDQDPTFGHVVEARQQIDDGRLATAGGAQQGNRLAWFGHERDATQDGIAASEVAERHIVELDGAADLGQLEGARLVLDLVAGVQDLEDALG